MYIKNRRISQVGFTSRELKIFSFKNYCITDARRGNQIRNFGRHAPQTRASPNAWVPCRPRPGLLVPRPRVPGNWSALEPRRVPEAWLSFAWSSPRSRRALASGAWPRFWSCSRSTGAFVTCPKRVSNVISICWFEPARVSRCYNNLIAVTHRALHRTAHSECRIRPELRIGSGNKSRYILKSST